MFFLRKIAYQLIQLNMIKKILFTGLLLLAFLSVFAQNKEEKKIIYSRIELKRTLLESYFENAVTDSIAAMFTPNCHLAMEFGEIIESREKVRKYYKSDFKSGKKISSYKLKVKEVKVYDDIVVELGTNSIEYAILPDKKLYREKYNYMFVWKRSKKDKYRLRAAIWNSSENPCE